MSSPVVDYSALADQARKSTPVDYTALADKVRRGDAENPPVTYAGTSPLGGGVDLAAGALAGLAKTGVGAYDLAKKVTDMQTPSGKVSVLPPSDKAHALIDKYAPTTLPGKVGQYGEQAAEFAVPGGAVEDAMKGASLLPRVAAQAGLGGVISAVQSGGDPASMAAGAALGTVGPALGHALPGAGISGPADLTNSVERRAIDFMKSKDVPVSVGQDTGQIGLQRVEQSLQNFPGSATRAQQFYRNAQGKISEVGNDLSAQPSAGSLGPGASALDANGVWQPTVGGQAVIDSLGKRVDDLKSYADKLYDSTRQTTARNVQSVQTGTQDIPASTILDSSGRPMSPAQTVPVMENIQSPVDLGPVRAQLKPVYQDLLRKLPVGQQEYSPAFAALKDVMTGDATQMSAMDFDNFLGAVKHISRNGDSPFLSTQSQRLAHQVIDAGEKSFQDALADAGPNVSDKLMRARKAVAAYHDTADLLGSMRSSEPGALYKQLLSPADMDGNINRLKLLNQVAPNAMSTVARTYLEGLVAKATAEGGFGRSAGIMADWKRLGPQTKKLLFGPDLTQQIDNFMIGAKRLTENTNPSGSASTIAAMGGLGAAGEMVRALVTGSPGEAAVIGTTAFAVPNIAARILFRPGGAQLLNQAIRFPVDSPALANTMQALTAMAQAVTTKRGANPPNQRPNYAPPGTQGAVVDKYQPGGGILAPVPPPGIGAPRQ